MRSARERTTDKEYAYGTLQNPTSHVHERGVYHCNYPILAGHARFRFDRKHSTWKY